MPTHQRLERRLIPLAEKPFHQFPILAGLRRIPVYPVTDVTEGALELSGHGQLSPADDVVLCLVGARRVDTWKIFGEFSNGNQYHCYYSAECQPRSTQNMACTQN